MASSAISLKPLDQMARDQFAAAMELVFAQEKIDPLPSGHISIESKDRGGQYGKWRRIDALGKPTTPQYLGSIDSDTYEQALAHKAELERIERSAKHLRKLGFSAEDHGSAIVLAALANAGYFSGGGVLVGTRAYRCLANHLGYSTAAIATQDIDIVRPCQLSLANPLPEGGLLALLKETGLKFIEVPGLRRSEPGASWRVVGKEIKLDLLVPAKSSRTAYQTIRVPELGAHATALEYLDYLMEEPMDGLVIGKYQLVPVKLPAPARFMWHKLALAALRPSTFQAKASKDIAQAASLVVMLAADEPEVVVAGRAMKTSMKKLVARSMAEFTKVLNARYKDVAEMVVTASR